MLACAGAVGWMTRSDDFALGSVELSADVRYADVDGILTAVGLEPGNHPNVVSLRTERMRERMLEFAEISEASVRVLLPNRVLVTLAERTPVLALRHGVDTYVVDRDGVILAAVDPAEAAALALPTVDDRRGDWAIDVEVGGSLEPIDLAAMLQLAALTPAAIGSAAGVLELSIDDEDGYVMSTDRYGWQAVFGHYTPTLRPPDLIPRQVQCLRSLLAQDEAALARVYLAPVDERCGTFLPTPGPRTSPTPEPSA